ncbi:MAG TPA: diguanylate cyclase [Ilumatobacteraceae bacterium]|nr:diguanylate cyclase [Ilumatobacteraceae bacterium]
MPDEQYYKRLEEVLDALPERVVRYRVPDLTIVYCNASWAAWYDLVPEQVLGRKLDEFLSDDGKAGLATQLARLDSEHPVLTDPVARLAPNRPGRWVEWVDSYLPGEDGAEILAVGRDVTARHLAELRLAESEARFRALADKASDVLWHFVPLPQPHLDYVSPSVEQMLGRPASYFTDDFEHFLSSLTDQDRLLIENAITGGHPLPRRLDLHYIHANGSVVIGEMDIRTVAGGVQGVARDVTELRRLQESLAALALRDPLTGLANRRLFKELLDADLARTQRSGQPLAVAYIDLDDFKNINDTYGHETGDAVLCETAHRLREVVRGADVVARLGGDEFVIVYEPNDPSADRMLQRISVALSSPIEIPNGVAVYCPASIGVADTRTVGYDGPQLLAAADSAMYETKRAHHRVTPTGSILITPGSRRRPSIIRETFDTKRL